MKNAFNNKLLGRVAVFAVAGSVAVGQFAGFFRNNAVAAQAEEVSEIVYCADTVYGDDIFSGQGTMTESSYTIDCDEKVLVSYAKQASVPSYGNNDASMQNICGPVAGTNIVVYYDRWYENLISNFQPGMVITNGEYSYFPNLYRPQTKNLIRDLYEFMRVEEVGGTTSKNFRSGLTSYVEAHGYELSFSSMYQSETMVNLSTLTTAINQGKVGIVMCSEYNFVYSIDQMISNGSVTVSRNNSTTAHMMMVFGYETLAFYKNGEYICTKTFLTVCSGYDGNDIGYMELSDFSVINEAYIVSIT